MLKPSIAAINRVLMDTLAACGDVNRNVMCSVNPHTSPLHAAALNFSKQLSDHLTPNTSAYAEIWLDDVKVSYEPEQRETIPLTQDRGSPTLTVRPFLLCFTLASCR